MKLHQNQLWCQGDNLYRIVHLERLSVDYKKVDESHPDGGTHHQVTKKEFCRLIKGATAVPRIDDDYRRICPDRNRRGKE